MTELDSKFILGAIGTFLTIATLIWKGSKKITEHDGRITEHDGAIAKTKKEIDAMKADFEKKIDGLKSEMSEIKAHNREDHQTLFKTSADTNSKVNNIDGKIDGFLLGLKKETA